MKLRLLALGALCGLLAVLAWPLVGHARAQRIAENIAPQLLFRIVADQPVAAPDGRSAVNNWHVVVFRETHASDKCYVAFISGSSSSVSGPTTCPQ